MRAAIVDPDERVLSPLERMSAFRRLYSRIERLPLFAVIVGAIALATALLVIYPLGRLIFDIFFEHDAFGTFSLSETFGDKALPTALLNTLILIVAAGAISLTIGAVFAWLNERTDVRMKWAADTLPIIPLMVPQLTVAIGWVLLFAPRAGFGNVLYRMVFDPKNTFTGTGPVNIYSMGGMIFVTVIVTVPLTYLTVSAALRNMDPALEEASLMSGAGPMRTLFKVTLPAIRNALAAAAVIVVILLISLFSVPIIIGGPASIDVLSTTIYNLLYSSGGTPRLGSAVLLSVFMLVVIQVVVVIEYAITRRGRHASIGGRARASGVQTSLGVLRIPARVLMILYLICATVFPMIALLVVSLQGFWTPDIKWNLLSFMNYQQILDSDNALAQAFRNSLFLGIITATVLTVAAAVIAFYTATARGGLVRLTNVVTTLPASVPHVVIGIAFLVVLASGKYGIGGTLLVLFLAYVVMVLPQASRSAGSAMSQIGRELREASVMSGASQVRTFIRIVLPLMGTGLLACWVIVFTATFGEISASIFLSGPTNPVTGPTIVDTWSSSGTYPQLAALALMVGVIQTIVVMVVRALPRFLRSRRNRRAGGGEQSAAEAGLLEVRSGIGS